MLGTFSSDNPQPLLTPDDPMYRQIVRDVFSGMSCVIDPEVIHLNHYCRIEQAYMERGLVSVGDIDEAIRRFDLGIGQVETYEGVNAGYLRIFGRFEWSVTIKDTNLSHPADFAVTHFKIQQGRTCLTANSYELLKGGVRCHLGNQPGYLSDAFDDPDERGKALIWCDIIRAVLEHSCDSELEEDPL